MEISRNGQPSESHNVPESPRMAHHNDSGKTKLLHGKYVCTSVQ